ncbi:kinase-like protein [Aureobasidium pullulans]|uniref:Autophagy-related protein 1 n=1 Tax=Aureobasidium pullulans TaxID=5580 RepID=A0AB74IGW1_AURPU|nr:kinase-like protein [Aureobasidium pullulans]
MSTSTLPLPNGATAGAGVALAPDTVTVLAILVKATKTKRNKCLFQGGLFPICYGIRELFKVIANFLYRVWQTLMPQTLTPPGTPVNQGLSASSSEITFFGLSIQYLIKDVVKKQQSFPRCFWHNLGICSCRNLDEISALNQAESRGLYYSGGHGDFDKFGPMEHNFVVKHELLTGSEAASCVAMQHIYTERRRNLYVFKIVTKQKSLFSHPEWGIVSNEAYFLLGILKTNLQAHSNIVQLFNCVTTKARAGLFLHILQMEYCDGGDLWELNSRCLKHGARIPKSLVIHIFKSLVTALAYLHHGLILLSNRTTQRHFLPASPKRWQTILHNDIKPENILLRWPASASESSRFPEIVLSALALRVLRTKS